MENSSNVTLNSKNADKVLDLCIAFQEGIIKTKEQFLREISYYKLSRQLLDHLINKSKNITHRNRSI